MITSRSPIITILYATETGNAEEIAYIICSKLNTIKIRCNVGNIKDYDITNLPEETYIIFVVSTTGDGDVPSNMKMFWNYLLRKSLPSNSLNNLKFIIFGLGDSSYEKFNAVARKLEKRLLQLSGIELCDIGLGDDQATYGYFSALNDWISNVLMIFQQQLSIHYYHHLSMHDNHMNPSYNVIIRDDNCESSDDNDINKFNSNINNTTTASPVYEAIIHENIRLTDNAWEQDVRHIKMEVNVSSSTANQLYYVGDIIEVYYRNPRSLIEKAINIIGHKESIVANTKLTIKQSSSISNIRPSRIGFISNCTLYELFERYLDIASIPKRSYFEKLSIYATNIDEKNKLLELSNAEGTDLYFDYCIRERKNYIEVLEEFPSTRPPLCIFLDLIPVIAPRQYSIASSPLLIPNHIDICAAITQRRTPYGRKRFGLCTGYLSSLFPGDKVYIRIKRGLIHNTPITNNKTPMILIGPGTGLAPMRALVQNHLMAQTLASSSSSNNTNDNNNATTNTEGSNMKEIVSIPFIFFFYGCRRKNKDCLYNDEWELINKNVNPYIQNNSIFKIIDPINNTTNNSIESTMDKSIIVDIAYSQEQLKKNYVTHHLINNGKQVCDMILEQEANIFISGSSKRMPSDVKKSFLTILTTYSDMSTEEAELYLAKLVRSKRYIVEAWS